MKNSYIPALRFDALTRFYDPVVQWTTRERTVKHALLKRARVPAGATVIDIGCGTGTLAILLKQRHPDARVIGLDADPPILARARTKAAKAEVNVEFVEGDATALPFEDEFADRVVSSLFFHHLTHDSKQQAFAHILRVLRPGGELHIADWGAPQNVLMRLLFFPVRVLDGFSNTRDNVRGQLPTMLRHTGATEISMHETFSTVFGSLTLLQCEKLVLPDQASKRA